MLTLDHLLIQQQGFTLTANWRISAGQMVTIIGPSGGGKSTLLAAIAGFIQPESGQIWANGENVTRSTPVKRPVSLLFQDHNLFPHLSIADNVALGLSPRLKLDQNGRNRVTASLATVGLSGFGSRKPGALSGGQQSRAALARILLMSRPVVLMDEPFSALGPAMRNEMLDLVTTTLGQTGATLLMVTHDPKDALHLAGSTVLVDQGVAQAPIDTKNLFADPPQSLRDYLG